MCCFEGVWNTQPAIKATSCQPQLRTPIELPWLAGKEANFSTNMIGDFGGRALLRVLFNHKIATETADIYLSVDYTIKNTLASCDSFFGVCAVLTSIWAKLTTYNSSKRFNNTYKTWSFFQKSPFSCLFWPKAHWWDKDRRRMLRPCEWWSSSKTIWAGPSPVPWWIGSPWRLFLPSSHLIFRPLLAVSMVLDF